jgi:hypothetical protein
MALVVEKYDPSNNFEFVSHVMLFGEKSEEIFSLEKNTHDAMRWW